MLYTCFAFLGLIWLARLPRSVLMAPAPLPSPRFPGQKWRRQPPKNRKIGRKLPLANCRSPSPSFSIALSLFLHLSLSLPPSPNRVNARLFFRRMCSPAPPHRSRYRGWLAARLVGKASACRGELWIGRSRSLTVSNKVHLPFPTFCMLMGKPCQCQPCSCLGCSVFMDRSTFHRATTL